MNAPDNSNSSSRSHYNVFLDNYNKGNEFLNRIIDAYLNQASTDIEVISAKADDPLKSTFSQLKIDQKEDSMDNYKRIVAIGEVLVKNGDQVIGDKDPAVKKSGVNLLDGFLNIAKETQDQQLMDTAVRMMNNLKL